MLRNAALAAALIAVLWAAPARATDSTDFLVLENTIGSSAFQDRCRLRFLNAAIQATTENVVAATNAVTAQNSNALHFASAPGSVAVGWTASDPFAPGAVPAGALVTSIVTGTVTLNQNIASAAGVANGDAVTFAPPSHAQRMAFAGALFAGSVDIKMLTMAVLASPTIKAEILAAPTVVGGTAADSDIDAWVFTIFTGLATSRSW